MEINPISSGTTAAQVELANRQKQQQEAVAEKVIATVENPPEESRPKSEDQKIAVVA